MYTVVRPSIAVSVSVNPAFAAFNAVPTTFKDAAVSAPAEIAEYCASAISDVATPYWLDKSMMPLRSASVPITLLSAIVDTFAIPSSKSSAAFVLAVSAATTGAVTVVIMVFPTPCMLFPIPASCFLALLPSRPVAVRAFMALPIGAENSSRSRNTASITLLILLPPQDVSLPLPVLLFPVAKTLLQCAFPPVPCYKTASVSIPFPGTGCTWHLHPSPSKSVFYVVIRLLAVSGQ